MIALLTQSLFLSLTVSGIFLLLAVQTSQRDDGSPLVGIILVSFIGGFVYMAPGWIEAAWTSIAENRVITTIFTALQCMMTLLLLWVATGIVANLEKIPDSEASLPAAHK